MAAANFKKKKKGRTKKNVMQFLKGKRKIKKSQTYFMKQKYLRKQNNSLHI